MPIVVAEEPVVDTRELTPNRPNSKIKSTIEKIAPVYGHQEKEKATFKRPQAKKQNQSFLHGETFSRRESKRESRTPEEHAPQGQRMLSSQRATAREAAA